jgi:hypothetical protein
MDGLAVRPDEFVINGHSWMVLPEDLMSLLSMGIHGWSCLET